MAMAVRAPSTTTDRRWTAVTVGLALVGVVLAIAGMYDAGAVVGFLGVLAGGWAMLISRNRTERFEVVTATVAAGVVVAACLAYGSGFSV